MCCCAKAPPEAMLRGLVIYKYHDPREMPVEHAHRAAEATDG